MNPVLAPRGRKASGHHASVVRRVAAVMAFEAITLAVASTLHLSGHVHGRGKPFDADHAGIIEAIIGAALAAGAIAMLRAPARARTIGIVLNSLAAAGFLNGLNMTARGGDAPDIAYHLGFLPVLIGSVIVLARTPGRTATNAGPKTSHEEAR